MRFVGTLSCSADAWLALYRAQQSSLANIRAFSCYEFGHHRGRDLATFVLPGPCVCAAAMSNHSVPEVTRIVSTVLRHNSTDSKLDQIGGRLAQSMSKIGERMLNHKLGRHVASSADVDDILYVKDTVASLE